MAKNFSETIKFKNALVEFHFRFNGTENTPIYKVHNEDKSLDFLMVRNAGKFEIIPLLMAPDAIRMIETELNEAIHKNVSY